MKPAPEKERSIFSVAPIESELDNLFSLSDIILLWATHSL